MDEVQQVGDGRPQPLDADGVDAMDRLDDGLRGVTALAGVQQRREGALVVPVLVDVGDAQLGLPVEGLNPMSGCKSLGSSRFFGLAGW